jgi:hypothetical protein
MLFKMFLLQNKNNPKKNCKNEVIRVYTSLSESNRVYTSMSRLIFDHMIVFMNDSFIIRTKTERSSRAVGLILYP